MYKNIVVLTGAGISAESGIPVFRSETGLWEQERIEDVCVPDALIRNPKKVHDFYNKMRLSLKTKAPNPAHIAITKLQKMWPQKSAGCVSIVTQNIDDLHEKAEGNDVIHMHGLLRSMKCSHCGKNWPWEEDSHPDDICPCCGRKGTTRPDIVFFEEMPYFMNRIQSLLSECDLFMAIGTSGVVYPAAGFCQIARSCGALCVEFNLEKSNVASDFNYGLYGKASQTIPAFVDHLLETGQALEHI